ncbi:YolD-like family protein [Virgibacillus halophilus]|uniref:YolD-like family protein n=1 Tax=Tigheibacillus halophilus TaxID=361280 RepID=A0ABU5C9F3_9BACI|nr:YolD-like family protein [Virgibacillus halophilus]
MGEDQIAEININLQHALEYDLPIEVKYFKNNDHHKIKGHLLSVDPLNNILNINEEYLPLDSVTDAHL